MQLNSAKDSEFKSRKCISGKFIHQTYFFPSLSSVKGHLLATTRNTNFHAIVQFKSW